MTSVYIGVIKRIQREAEDLERVARRALRGWQAAKTSADNQDLYLDSVALNLQGFYSGLERIFEQIARRIDQSLPTGEAWHLELLQQMSQEWKKVRPAVISSASARELDEFRRFRHVVRNVYAENLISEKMEKLLTLLPRLGQQLRIELLAFADFLKILDTQE